MTDFGSVDGSASASSQLEEPFFSPSSSFFNSPPFSSTPDATNTDAISIAQSFFQENLASNPSYSRTPSQSGTPGGSITSRRPRNRNPSTLAYYSPEVQEVLTLAKELFAATSFASGLFFVHKRSLHLSTFRTFALEALAQASQDRQSTYLNSIRLLLCLLNPITIF
jgi:hypothetical protein